MGGIKQAVSKGTFKLPFNNSAMSNTAALDRACNTLLDVSSTIQQKDSMLEFLET